MAEMRSQADSLSSPPKAPTGRRAPSPPVSEAMSHDSRGGPSPPRPSSSPPRSPRSAGGSATAPAWPARAASTPPTTDQQVAGLADAAQKIGDVVRLINDIAEQDQPAGAERTTIEAARAGEAGKGFAGVAQEGQEPGDPDRQGDRGHRPTGRGMQTATGSTVEAIRTIADVIRRLDETPAYSPRPVEEQDATTRSISESVQKGGRRDPTGGRRDRAA